MLVFRLPEELGAIAARALIEFLLWVVILVLTERPLTRLARVFKWSERALASLGRNRRLAVTGVFLLVFVCRLALLPIFSIPGARFCDEFSQLLSADTFAHGRVTNPTHPMSFYFETFMQNQKPTYDSMYPPGPGLFMGTAEALTGYAWFGVLFYVAAAAAAMCWMLQAWVPPRWALWGTLVFIVIGARGINKLSEVYLGEGVLVLGGALVLGAIPRIIRQWPLAGRGRSQRSRGVPRSSIWTAVLLGVGIALLAMTRPYEGAFLVTGLGIGGICWAWKSGMRTGTLLRRVAVPVALILLPAFAFLGYLNRQATGSALVAPYQVNLVAQHLTRPFVWQKPVNPPPHYDHAVMATFYDQWEMDWFRSIRRFPQGVALFFAQKIDFGYSAIVWPLGFLLVVGCWQLLKNPTLRFLPLAFLFFVLGLSVETYQLLARYVAPAWGLVILLVIYGLRHVALWRRRGVPGAVKARVGAFEKLHGLRMVRGAIVLILAALILHNGGTLVYTLTHSHPEPYFVARQQVLKGLEALPGKQLVIVRYSATHYPEEEWVYNRADIDSAKVVWARDVRERGNADLLEYFKDRTVWLLEPDGDYAKLTPYCSDGNVGPESASVTGGASAQSGFAASKPGSQLNVLQVGAFRVSCCGGPCQAPK